MSSDNKALIRRVFEDGINKRNFKLFDDLVAPNYINYSLPAPVPGPVGLKQVVGMFLEAFPDMQVRIDQVVAEGECVVTRGAFRGTHRGPFMGVPATGKIVTVPYLDMWRVEQGKAAENWVQMDLLGLMQQLGAVPAP